MKFQAKLHVLDIHKKISTMGKVYYELDLDEKLEHKDINGNPISKKWERMYLPEHSDEEKLKAFRGEKALITFNAFFQERKSGERTYQDVKLAIVDVEEITEREESNTEE